MIRDPITPQAKLIVTGVKTESLRECKRLLRDAFPHARVRNAGFRCVFVIESENDPLTLAADLEHQAHSFIGHITSVLSKTETNADAISEAAVRIVASSGDLSFRIKPITRGKSKRQSATGVVRRTSVYGRARDLVGQYCDDIARFNPHTRRQARIDACGLDADTRVVEEPANLSPVFFAEAAANLRDALERVRPRIVNGSQQLL